MMKYIGRTPLSALLPGSIRDDATVAASAASLDPIRRALAGGIPNILLWSRLDPAPGRLCPPLQRLAELGGGLKALSEAELELLAWQLHVDFREAAATREQLAAMVRSAIPWHRIKGTPASIKQALALFGYGRYPATPPGTAAGRAAGAQQEPRFLQATAHPAQDARGGDIIIEEDGTGDHWATWQLGLPEIADEATVRHIVSICNEMQPARCRLWRIYTDVFDRRPIVPDVGPVLDDGWLDFYSGASVNTGGETGESDSVLVSFGATRRFLSEAYGDIAGSFGTTIRRAFLIPYLDRFVLDRSRLDEVYPRNHGFASACLYSLLWADRATTGRRWRGEWDARRWRDYTGFDRKLPRWSMRARAWSRNQLALDDGERLDDGNARLDAVFAVLVDNPPRLDAFALDGHDPMRREPRLHEMFVDMRGMTCLPLRPGTPCSACAEQLGLRAANRNAARVGSAGRGEFAAMSAARRTEAPRAASVCRDALTLDAPVMLARPSLAVSSLRRSTWTGTWGKYAWNHAEWIDIH